jgi:hypothetical protein
LENRGSNDDEPRPRRWIWIFYVPGAPADSHIAEDFASHVARSDQLVFFIDKNVAC